MNEKAVFQANTPNKNDYAKWKSIKSCAQKWCQKLCAFLFEVTWVYGKMCRRQSGQIGRQCYNKRPHRALNWEETQKNTNAEPFNQLHAFMPLLATVIIFRLKRFWTHAIANLDEHLYLQITQVCQTWESSWIDASDPVMVKIQFLQIVQLSKGSLAYRCQFVKRKVPEIW